MLLTGLLNELAALPEPLLLLLDDYHAVDSPTVDQALTTPLEHPPPGGFLPQDLFALPQRI